MARLKTQKYEFDGEEIAVNFNCSTSGIFSVNIHCTIQEKLGLQGRLEYSSLKELEDVIDNAFRAYKEANTSYKLMIAICFGASGEFKKKPDGEWNEKFLPFASNPHNFTISMHSVTSAVGLDYRVLIEENRDGRISYYKARHISFNPFNEDKTKLKHLTGDYHSIGNTYIRGEEKLIEYSDTALNNLNSISLQLQKASSFLVNLVTSNKLDLFLNSSNMNLLTQ